MIVFKILAWIAYAIICMIILGLFAHIAPQGGGLIGLALLVLASLKD